MMANCYLEFQENTQRMNIPILTDFPSFIQDDNFLAIIKATHYIVPHIYERIVTCKANGLSLIKCKMLRILCVFSVTFRIHIFLFPIFENIKFREIKE